jgi:energy-coupling factor transporter ATP-binding protein EcfA2
MIIRSIELSGWRSFIENVAVGSFSEHLNVIHGPNGTGKSSLFEALRRSLMDRYDVTGQEINEVRPWGRALSPKITVTFCHSGAEYRVHKQFLEGGFCTLMRQENGDYRPLAEGRPADDMIRELLSKSAPGRGLSQSKHWGMAQALWAPQGELRITEVSEDLINNIHRTLGLQMTDKAVGPIENRVRDRYLQYFSPQGKIKTGKGAPRLVQLQEGLAKAKETRALASESLRKSEVASRKVEDLDSSLRQLSLETDELEKSVLKAREDADQFRALEVAESSKRSEHDRIAAQYAELNARIKTIQDAENELGEEKSALAIAESELPILQKDSEAKDELSRKAEEQLEAVRKQAEIVSLSEKEAEAAHTYLDCLKANEELGKRISKIETAARNLAALAEGRSNLVAPDVKTIKSLRRLFQDRNDAERSMDFALLRLEITPKVNGRLDVVKGEEPGTIKLSAGATATVKGSPEIVAIIDGIAKMVISGPPGDFATYRLTFREKQTKILDVAQPYGTAEPDALEALFDKACQLDTKLGQAQNALDVLCEGNDKTALISEQARTGAIAANLGQLHPAWKKKAPDFEVLRREALDLRRDHIAAARNSERNWKTATEAVAKAKEHFESALRQVADAKQNIRKIELRLADAIKDGKTKDERGGLLQGLLLDRNATGEALKELKKKIDDFGGNPSVTLTKLEKSLDIARSEIQKTRDAERTAAGNLEILIAGGPYSIWVNAEEEIARLEEAILQDQLEMNSIKMLSDTLSDCRSTMLAAYARPVEEAATRLMRRIAGGGIGKIEISDQLVPSGVFPESASELVVVENLSGGEQEQLYFATRLALAEVLAEDERQMVVMDDVLTATDTPRFARILTILEEAVDRLQVLILTCHPERYRALTDARFIDLESLINRGA